MDNDENAKAEPKVVEDQGDHQHMDRGNRGRRGGGPNRFGNRRQGPYQPRNNMPPRNGPGPQGGSGGGGGDGVDNPNWRRRGPGGPRGGPGGNDGRNVDRVNDKFAQMTGPTFDLPPLDTSEKKFSGRARLYVGNLPQDTDEDQLKEMFAPYGESSEYFINAEKSFAFVKMDYRANAEKAKKELDGQMLKNKPLRIRFAPNGSTIKVRNLSSVVTNELLFTSFQPFGEIERALVHVDDRGKPTGDGIVEFSRKGYALHAVRKCTEECLFITSSLRPCIVELYEPGEDGDGFPEKSVPRRNPEYMQLREVGPRIAESGSFEHEYGTRWKRLYELFDQKEKALKEEFQIEKEKLEAQMDMVRYEHETEMLRNQLRAREMDRERHKQEWEMRERMAEEQRLRNEEAMRRQQEELQSLMVHQEEELRRRQQENNLFLQANQLDNMLEEQEQASTFTPNGQFENSNQSGNAGPVLEPKAFLNTFNRNARFEAHGEMGQNNGPRGGGGGRGHWVNANRRDDHFPQKRRRF